MSSTLPGLFPRKDGFSLVECLVVIALLGMLVALLMPVLAKTQERGFMVQSINNLRQLVAANQSYAAEHGHFAPASDQWNNKRWHGGRTGPESAFDPAQGFLADYLGASRRVGICPLFLEMTKGSDSFENGTGGYGYNSSYVGGLPSGGWQSDGARVSARTAQVPLTKTIMFATSGYATGEGIQEYPYVEPPFWDFGNGPSRHRPSPSVHFRFNDQALVGWCDGRVTTENCDPREVGFNPHQGDANAQQLGWFGPDAENGFWNPNRSP